MATADLNNTGTQIDLGNDSIVIVENLETIPGGRTLDVTGFTPEVIKAGHMVIHETSTDEYKPMPLAASGGITALGNLSSGSGYTNDGTYTDVALTGGAGSGAKATIVVESNEVISATITTPGSGYQDGDSLSAAAADIGTTGSGFAVVAIEVDSSGDEYASLPEGHTYAGVVIASVMTNKPFVGILVRGTVNPSVAPFPMTSILTAVKTALPLIRFVAD